MVHGLISCVECRVSIEPDTLTLDIYYKNSGVLTPEFYIDTRHLTPEISTLATAGDARNEDGAARSSGGVVSGHVGRSGRDSCHAVLGQQVDAAVDLHHYGPGHLALRHSASTLGFWAQYMQRDAYALQPRSCPRMVQS